MIGVTQGDARSVDDGSCDPNKPQIAISQILLGLHFALERFQGAQRYGGYEKSCPTLIPEML